MSTRIRQLWALVALLLVGLAATSASAQAPDAPVLLFSAERNVPMTIQHRLIELYSKLGQVASDRRFRQEARKQGLDPADEGSITLLLPFEGVTLGIFAETFRKDRSRYLRVRYFDGTSGQPLLRDEVPLEVAILAWDALGVGRWGWASNQTVLAGPYAFGGRIPLEELLFPVVVGVCALTGLRLWPITWMETLGFVSGGVCVWLAVREHLGTWPLGIANNVVFFALFWRERLFADAVLQIVYLALALYGWWSWLRGGERWPALVARLGGPFFCFLTGRKRPHSMFATCLRRFP